MGRSPQSCSPAGFYGTKGPKPFSRAEETKLDSEKRKGHSHVCVCVCVCVCDTRGIMAACMLSTFPDQDRARSSSSQHKNWGALPDTHTCMRARTHTHARAIVVSSSIETPPSLQ